jgi:aryl-alcohol dehydrogenase-like predicted oxidoreductase
VKYNRLGKTGLKVSELCLGTMTFGSKFFNIGVVNQEQANRMVARSLEAGINFFDTANVYSFGESEEILGRALKAVGVKREAVVVATKVRGPMSEAAAKMTGDVNNSGLSRQHIMAACDASLRRLGVEHIDLYQVHGWDVQAPMDETLRALEDLVRQGKVLYPGCSNWAGRQLMKAICLAEASGWDHFVSLQAYYSLVARDLEHELLPLAREEGLAVLPWSPLSGGFLTGKYRRDKNAPPDARRASFDFPPIDQARGYDAVEQLERVAQETGASIARAALAWLLAQPGITSVIIGANKESQLEDNLKAAELKLTEDQVAQLSATTQPPKLYPQWMIEFQNSPR